MTDIDNAPSPKSTVKPDPLHEKVFKLPLNKEPSKDALGDKLSEGALTEEVSEDAFNDKASVEDSLHEDTPNEKLSDDAPSDFYYNEAQDREMLRAVADAYPSQLSFQRDSRLPAPKTCNYCLQDFCYKCDPSMFHVCGMYLEALRMRHANSLPGCEYMSKSRWAWEGLLNVAVPARFFRDMEQGTEMKWRGTYWMVLGYMLWAVSTVLMLIWWVAFFPVTVLYFLIEDKMWRE